MMWSSYNLSSAQALDHQNAEVLQPEVDHYCYSAPSQVNTMSRLRREWPRPSLQSWPQTGSFFIWCTPYDLFRAGSCPSWHHHSLTRGPMTPMWCQFHGLGGYWHTHSRHFGCYFWSSTWSKLWKLVSDLDCTMNAGPARDGLATSTSTGPRWENTAHRSVDEDTKTWHYRQFKFLYMTALRVMLIKRRQIVWWNSCAIMVLHFLPEALLFLPKTVTALENVH